MSSNLTLQLRLVLFTQLFLLRRKGLLVGGLQPSFCTTTSRDMGGEADGKTKIFADSKLKQHSKRFEKSLNIGIQNPNIFVVNNKEPASARSVSALATAASSSATAPPKTPTCIKQYGSFIRVLVATGRSASSLVSQWLVWLLQLVGQSVGWSVGCVSVGKKKTLATQWHLLLREPSRPERSERADDSLPWPAGTAEGCGWLLVC